MSGKLKRFLGYGPDKLKYIKQGELTEEESKIDNLDFYHLGEDGTKYSDNPYPIGTWEHYFINAAFFKWENVPLDKFLIAFNKNNN